MIKIKKSIAVAMVLVTMSLPAFAQDSVISTPKGFAKYVAPQFSIKIGSAVFGLDYANNIVNQDQIALSLLQNHGDIYIQKSVGEWINNTTGDVETQATVDTVPIATFNGKEIGETLAAHDSLVITIKDATFGSMISVSLPEVGTTKFTNARKYKVFDTKGIVISRISDLGNATVVFPVKEKGDTVLIKLYDNNDTIVDSVTVIL